MKDSYRIHSHGCPFLRLTLINEIIPTSQCGRRMFHKALMQGKDRNKVPVPATRRENDNNEAEVILDIFRFSTDHRFVPGDFFYLVSRC